MKAGDVIIRTPATSEEELAPFIESINSCPKTGLHNPLKNPERYVMLGEVSHKVLQLCFPQQHTPDVAFYLSGCHHAWTRSRFLRSYYHARDAQELRTSIG